MAITLLIALGFQTQIVAGTNKQQKNIFCKLVTTLMNGYFLILGVFIHIEILSYFHSENKKQFSMHVRKQFIPGL